MKRLNKWRENARERGQWKLISFRLLGTLAKSKKECEGKSQFTHCEKIASRVPDTKQDWKNEAFKENLLRLLSSSAFASIRLDDVEKQAEKKDDEESERAEQFKAIKSSPRSRFESDWRTA